MKIDLEIRHSRSCACEGAGTGVLVETRAQVRDQKSGEIAFSLLEVMIAMALFFTAIFAILSLTSQSLGAARQLQLSHVDIGGLAGMISLTNRVEEGALPQEIVAQFEEFNPGYTCTGEIMEVSSNGLFRVDFEVVGLHGKKVVGSTMSILMFRPESAASSRSKLRSVPPNPGR